MDHLHHLKAPIQVEISHPLQHPHLLILLQLSQPLQAILDQAPSPLLPLALTQVLSRPTLEVRTRLLLDSLIL